MLQTLLRLISLAALLQLVACATVQPVPVQPSRATLESYRLIENSRVQIAAVGDIMLGAKGLPLLNKRGYDYPFAATKHLLTQADIAIGNLETPLTDRGEPLVEKKYLFRSAPIKVASALKRAGFDIVSLANNHTLDYGIQGLEDTMRVLDDFAVRHHGAGLNEQQARQPVVFTLSNGQSLGFLAYANVFPEEFWAQTDQAGVAFGHERHVRADVAQLQAQGVDIIVASFHWGRERQTELRPYQPLLAHAAIDAGADLVIGHHPHILQGIEQYKDGLILYSLGNYTFTTYSPHVHHSVVANITFEAGKFTALNMTPIKINNFNVQLQPQLLNVSEAKLVYEALQGLSETVNLQLTEQGGIQLKKQAKASKVHSQ